MPRQRELVIYTPAPYTRNCDSAGRFNDDGEWQITVAIELTQQRIRVIGYQVEWIGDREPLYHVDPETGEQAGAWGFKAPAPEVTPTLLARLPSPRDMAEAWAEDYGKGRLEEVVRNAAKLLKSRPSSKYGRVLKIIEETPAGQRRPRVAAELGVERNYAGVLIHRAQAWKRAQEDKK